MNAKVTLPYPRERAAARDVASPRWTRAARAEQWRRSRLRARLARLAWPATLAGLTGGFAAVVVLRLAGV